VTATAFDKLRALPESRKPAIVLPNIGTAIAVITPMSPMTISNSMSVKPDWRVRFDIRHSPSQAGCHGT
jgi:hypothetical protein